MHARVVLIEYPFNTLFTHIGFSISTSTSKYFLSEAELYSRDRVRQEFNERDHSNSGISCQLELQLPESVKTFLAEEKESTHGTDFDAIETNKRKREENEKDKSIQL